MGIFEGENAEKNLTRNMRILLITTISLSIIVVISAWFFHVYSGRSRVFLPFISETHIDDIEGTISRIGFTMMGISYPIIGWHIYNSKKLEIKRSELGETQILLNKFAYFVCIFQAISIVSVAYLPWSKYPIAHAVFANFVFAGGLIWAILYHKLDHDIDYNLDVKRKNHVLRSNLFIFWFIGIGLMIVGFLPALIRDPNLLNTLDFDKYQTEMLVAAIGEWIMFFASVAVFFTFYEDIIDLE